MHVYMESIRVNVPADWSSFEGDAADIPIEIAAQGSLVNSRYDMDRPKIQCPSPLPDASVTVKGSKFCKPNYIFNSSC